MSNEENKPSGGAGTVGSVFLGSFLIGTLLAGKKKVAGPHTSTSDQGPRFISNAKQKYKIKRDKLYLTGLKREENIRRRKNKLQSEARQRAIKESTLHNKKQSG